MGVAWWCEVCGASVRPTVLVVWVGVDAESRPYRRTCCSDRCAEVSKARSAAAAAGDWPPPGFFRHD
jgi:hypothetical protein